MGYISGRWPWFSGIFLTFIGLAVITGNKPPDFITSLNVIGIITLCLGIVGVIWGFDQGVKHTHLRKQ